MSTSAAGDQGALRPWHLFLVVSMIAASVAVWNSPDTRPATLVMVSFTAFNEKAGADGVLRSGEGLKGVETATSLRLRNGKVETMDGPFAETREHLGGYYVLDVPDLDTALRYAALIPAAQFGTIEVRPLMDYNPTNR